MRRWWLRIRHGRRVALGRGVRLARGVRIEAGPQARVVLEDGVCVGPRTRLLARTGELRVGRDARIGERCVVVAHAGVEIGAGAQLRSWSTVTDFEPVIDDPERPVRLQGVAARPVRIGARAVVDHAANVLAGARVGDGARVGPHAVVAGEVPPGARAEGAAPVAAVVEAAAP